ncbi:MAG: hypothetical protein IPP81_20015 [Chitinophagaceae bacterium]|nr:hypothetical protein [Chitinophagaceae bacterium]
MKRFSFITQLACLFLFSSLFSCNKLELSREEAAKMLKSQLNLPKDEIKKILLRDETGSFNMTRNFLKDLQNSGLVSMESPTGYPNATITENGMKYVKSKPHSTGNPYETGIDVLVASIDFGEITGIIINEGAKTAQVDYTLIRKVTPFGSSRQFKLQESPSNESKLFRKYDDGWRIQN